MNMNVMNIRNQAWDHMLLLEKKTMDTKKNYNEHKARMVGDGDDALICSHFRFRWILKLLTIVNGVSHLNNYILTIDLLWMRFEVNLFYMQCMFCSNNK
jgi:hypothetical protein